MIIALDEKQKRLIAEAGILFDQNRDYSEDEVEDIEATVENFLLKSCFDPGFKPTAKSEAVEDIITYLILLRTRHLN
jgi:hypothetical protein